MATPLANLQSAYRDVCAKIAEISVNPKPDYTLPGGITLKWGEYRKSLLDQEKSLREIPGVATDEMRPTFEVLG